MRHSTLALAQVQFQAEQNMAADANGHKAAECVDDWTVLLSISDLDTVAFTQVIAGKAGRGFSYKLSLNCRHGNKIAL